MPRRLIAIMLAVPLVLAACGRSLSAPPASNGYHLVLEEGTSGGKITIRDSGSGAIVRSLPPGTPSPDWSRYFVVDQEIGGGRLMAIEPLSGRSLGQRSIPSGYWLPQLGEGLPAGLSPNGEWIALTRQTHDSNGRISTGFIVGSSSLVQPMKTIELSGDFMFDALSNDGDSLYLIRRLDDTGHYQVRLYDVAKHVLTPRPVADKREPNEPMNGLRGDSVSSIRSAYVFTVYAREGGPFIHALPLGMPFAWCLDLPSPHATGIEEQFHWSLALTHDGSTLYAVNGLSGLISAVDAAKVPQGMRQGQLALAARSNGLAWLVTDAEAKGEAIGGAALSADERTLFAIASSGVAAVDTSTLTLRARYLDGHSITSIRLSTDGNWLYAAEPGAGVVWQINAQTGAVSGAVKGLVNPWAILWAGAGS